MKKIVIILSLLFVLQAVGAGGYSRDYEHDTLFEKNESSNDGTEYWGLFVGVNECYNCPEDSFVEQKMMGERLTDTLIISDFWQEDHIKTITDKNATKKNIIEGFKWLDEHEDENDVSFIFYAAHGQMMLEIFPPYDEEDRYDGLLTTYWTAYWDSLVIKTESLPLAILGAYLSDISDDQLNRLLANLESKGVVVLISVCAGGEYDDPPIYNSLYKKKQMKYHLTPENFTYRFCEDLQASNRIILMPCEEDEDVDGTWFIDYITKGLQGFADINDDGLVTAEEAFNYSAPLTYEMNRKYTYFHNHPSIFDDYPGELVLSQSELPPSTPKLIFGPTTGKKGDINNFIISAIEPENEQIRYYIEWGDGTNEYSDFYLSEEIVNLSHKWNTEGVFNFYIYSEDDNGAKSINSEKNVIAIADENSIDQVQINESYYNGYPISSNFQVAQSFKPNNDYITKIALPIYSRGFDEVHLQIKRNLTDDKILTEASVIVPRTYNYFTNGVYDWAIFDVKDINVKKNETYFMICYSDFFWMSQWRNMLRINSNNAYQEGSLFYSDNYGQSWKIENNLDACFVTYGK